MKSPPLVEQADLSKNPYFSGKARGYHQWLKKHKSKVTRAYVRDCLRKEEDPISNEGKYYGYET